MSAVVAVCPAGMRRRWAAARSPAARDSAEPMEIEHPSSGKCVEQLRDQAFCINDACEGQELCPGFIHFSGVLPLASQQRLLEVACEVARGSQPEGASGGWYRREGGKEVLNDGTKARFWDKIGCFPAEFGELGERLARKAGQDFPRHLSAPSADFKARVGALNFYTSRGRMNWHQDDYNFAKPDRPIVMASIGDDADFGYKLRAADREQHVVLRSGDVIVFGGRSRDLVHALLRVHPGTAPKELAFPTPPGRGRVSVTWRDVEEEDGLTFNSDERLGLVVTSNTLPRYRRKTRDPQERTMLGNGLVCVQCGQTDEERGKRRWHGQHYCAKCWRAWGG